MAAMEDISVVWTLQPHIVIFFDLNYPCYVNPNSGKNWGRG